MKKPDIQCLNIMKKLLDIECEIGAAEELIGILLGYTYENHVGIAEILEIVQNKLSKIASIIEK